MKKLVNFLFALLLLVYSGGGIKAQDNHSEQSCLMPDTGLEPLQNPDEEKQQPSSCNSYYVLRVNVHYILRDDHTGNFTEDSDLGSRAISNYQPWAGGSSLPDTTQNGYEFAKGMIWGINIIAQQNPQMQLPTGNTTPRLPKRIAYVLNGVYFHHSDALYDYDPINYSASPAGTLAPDQFNAFGINKGSEINIFMMGQNTAAMTYTGPSDRQYLTHSGGASGWGYSANNNWVKLGNLWRRHIWQRGVVSNNGRDPDTGWFGAMLLGHEIGHLLHLYHAFDPDGCADTPSAGVSGNNVMDYGTNQMALTPCQIGITQNELSTRYQQYTTCGCLPVNAFFTVPECVEVRPGADWVWLDARGSWADNATSGGYVVQEVDAMNNDIPGSTGVLTSFVGGPGRYVLHLAAGTHYRVTLTMKNACSTHTSVKYISTDCAVAPKSGVVAYSVYPNPTTDQFTVRSPTPLPAAPIVRDGQGQPVPVEQQQAQWDGTAWHTLFRLKHPQTGLYLVELGTGATRTVQHLSVQ